MRFLRHARRSGFTLLEMMIALAISGVIAAGVAGLVNTALASERITRERVRLVREADHAMHQIVRALRGSPRLVLPRSDVGATAVDESRRDLVAFLVDPELDRNRDGDPDVDADHDGRIDEDLDSDLNRDGKPGLRGIDDDMDGNIDEGDKDDDDEDGLVDEELPNGADDDGDGAIDEDLASDMNQDAAPGDLAIDDDGDGSVDENSDNDDDEDADDLGGTDEDSWDVALFHLVADDLILRLPRAHQSTTVDVLIATGVSAFEVHRIPLTGDERFQTIEVKLSIAGADGASFTITRQIRTKQRV